MTDEMRALREMLLSEENPVINGTGEASFGQNHYCLWCTTDGSTSICKIWNSGAANTLTFVVSGAPDTVYTTNGDKFVGPHNLPPNQPTKSVTAIADFKGQQVSIFNLSAVDTPCDVVTFSPSGGRCGPSTRSARRRGRSRLQTEMRK